MTAARLIGAGSMLGLASAALLVVAMWVLATGVGIWPPREEIRNQIDASVK